MSNQAESYAYFNMTAEEKVKRDVEGQQSINKRNITSDNIFLTHATEDNSVTKEDLYRYFYLAFKEITNGKHMKGTLALETIKNSVEDLEEALKYIDGK